MTPRSLGRLVSDHGDRIRPAAPLTRLLDRLVGDRRGRIGLATAAFVVFIALWEFVIWALRLEPVVLPRPMQVVQALWIGFGSGAFYSHLWVTFVETMAGFAIGAGIGLVLGVAIAESRILHVALYPYLIGFQTMPKVAIAPLFVIWFGFGMASKIAIAATISFFPVVVNVIAGLATADAARVEMLASFCASRWQIFRMVKLPSALPFLFAGLDVAIVLSVIGAIVAEFVGSQKGLGYLILQYNFSFNTAGVFAVLIVLSAMGVGLHLIVQWLQRRIVFWQRSHERVVGA